MVKAFSKCDFSIFLEPAQVACECLDFLRDTIVIKLPHAFFSKCSLLNSFFCSLCCEINSRVSSLLHKVPLLLTTLQSTRRHVCFQRKNDVIIPVYSEYWNTRNTFRVFQNRNSDSIERIFGVIPFIRILSCR